MQFDYVGVETGTSTLPFNTIGEGLLAVADGGTIFIQGGGSTPETPNITQNVKIRVVGETPATIGGPQ